MNMPAYELNYGSDDYMERGSNAERELASLYPKRFDEARAGFATSLLTRDQIRKINRKYKLTDLTCEEEEMLIQDLIEMGVLTEDDGCSYTKSGGNILESLTKQFGANIHLLYQMTITGRYSNLHIEIIKSQQKILNVLDQLMAEAD